jgi:hypothetical protein
MTQAITSIRLTKYLLCLLTVLAIRNLYSQSLSQPFTDVISASVITIKSGSNVRLDITIKSNSSERMILIDNRTGPEEAGISIWDGKGNQLPPRVEFKNYFTVSRFGMFIYPGKSLTQSVNLNKWFDLTTPGQYTVQAKRKVPKSDSVVESNKLTITVIP